jgi:hypothetical protein
VQGWTTVVLTQLERVRAAALCLPAYCSLFCMEVHSYLPTQPARLRGGRFPYSCGSLCRRGAESVSLTPVSSFALRLASADCLPNPLNNRIGICIKSYKPNLYSDPGTYLPLKK